MTGSGVTRHLWCEGVGGLRFANPPYVPLAHCSAPQVGFVDVFIPAVSGPDGGGDESGGGLDDDPGSYDEAAPPESLAYVLGDTRV
jgi:hypothetical protein